MSTLLAFASSVAPVSLSPPACVSALEVSLEEAADVWTLGISGAVGLLPPSQPAMVTATVMPTTRATLHSTFFMIPPIRRRESQPSRNLDGDSGSRQPGIARNGV
jgi:hypothetical protein